MKTLAPMESKFLLKLYDAFFAREDNFNWREWAQSEAIEVADVDRAFDELSAVRLCEASAIGPFAAITGYGVSHIEQAGLVDRGVLAARQTLRTELLKLLAHLRDEHGRHAMISWREVQAECGLKDEDFHTNAMYLEELGYLEFTSNMTIAITDAGYSKVEEYRVRVSFAERLQALHDGEVNAQRRGSKLETLIADVARHAGWNVDLNVRRPGEEVDVILSRDMSYFIISCKWEAQAVQTDAVRDLRERVTHRPGSKGILLSMSGFSTEAVNLARERMESAIILLFGPDDVDRSVRGSFTEIILRNCTNA